MPNADPCKIFQYSLRLERLRLAVRLGCEAPERSNPQAVEVSLYVRFPVEPAACRTDQLQDTLCTARLCAALRAAGETGERALLEHLAQRLHDAVRSLLPAAAQLDLHVTKLAPPIAGLRGGATFSIEESCAGQER